jgi:hypothetical protein
LYRKSTFSNASIGEQDRQFTAIPKRAKQGLDLRLILCIDKALRHRPRAWHSAVSEGFRK